MRLKSRRQPETWNNHGCGRVLEVKKTSDATQTVFHLKEELLPGVILCFRIGNGDRFPGQLKTG